MDAISHQSDASWDVCGTCSGSGQGCMENLRCSTCGGSGEATDCDDDDGDYAADRAEFAADLAVL